MWLLVNMKVASLACEYLQLAYPFRFLLLFSMVGFLLSGGLRPEVGSDHVR